MQVALAFNLAAVDAVGLVPVKLGEVDIAVVQLYAGGRFRLAPDARIIGWPSLGKVGDCRAWPDSEGLQKCGEDV